MKYRPLKIGDTIKKDDEFYDELNKKWFVVDRNRKVANTSKDGYFMRPIKTKDKKPSATIALHCPKCLHPITTTIEVTLNLRSANGLGAIRRKSITRSIACYK